MDSVSDSHCPIRANELTFLTATLVFKAIKVNMEGHYACLPCLSFIIFKFIFFFRASLKRLQLIVTTTEHNFENCVKIHYSAS